MHNRWKGKKVFISGGAGVIGTALVDQLLSAGAHLFVGDLKPQPAAWKSALRYRQGDLASMELEEIRSFSPEIYFHLAATFERSLENYAFWEENYHHNVYLSHRLLSQMQELPELKKIVFASSYLVYNPSLYMSRELRPLKETDEASPRNLCGMAKFFHERELAFISSFNQDLQVISARIFRSYGKGSRDIISRWIRSALQGSPLQVYCPEGRFDFIYAEDVATGLKKLAESNFAGVVNLGTGRPRLIQELLQLLITHFPGLKTEQVVSQIEVESSAASMEKFYAATGWNGFRMLEETLPGIIDYERLRI
jgi:carbamoyl-phosphate synthase large subunit